MTNDTKNLNNKLDQLNHYLEFLIHHMIGNFKNNSYQESGKVIAIDGAWGAGKTYFLDYFKKHIEKNGGKIYEQEVNILGSSTTGQNEPIFQYGKKNNEAEDYLECTIIQYNAWENDYFDDPFISLVGQTLKHFPEVNELISDNTIRTINAASMGILNGIRDTPILSQLIKTAENVTALLTEKKLDNSLGEYLLLEENQKKFQEALSSSFENKIVIYLVDELDRCRPDFSLKLLERIKHFFGLQNIVFIVALNFDEIVKMAEKWYGFSGYAYLSRFFDVTIDFRHYCANGFIKELSSSRDTSLLAIAEFFNLNPREIIKFTNTANTILKMTKSNSGYLELLFLCAIKLINFGLFKKIFQTPIDNIDDQESAESAKEKFINTFMNEIEKIKINRQSIFYSSLTYILDNLFIYLACTQYNNSKTIGYFSKSNLENAMSAYSLHIPIISGL